MRKLIALVAIALIAGSAAAADVQKIVIAKAEANALATSVATLPDAQTAPVAKAKVNARVRSVATAPIQKPLDDSRFDNYQLEAFSCCGLPQ